MSTDLRIRPCQYPTCRDENGQARLTTNTICDPCRTRYHRLLRWLLDDYTYIAQSMPRPVSTTETGRRAKRTSYGHEREWASDALHEIRIQFTEAEQYVREYLGDKPAKTRKRELVAVRQAYEYLTTGTNPSDPGTLHTPRFDALCRMYLSGDKAADMIELHHTIRQLTGQNLIVRRLPYACPRCNVQAVEYWPGGGRDYMQCGNCHELIEEKYYGLHARIAADELIERYDTLKEMAAEH